MSLLRDFGSAARSSGSPVTAALVALIVTGFLLGWFGVLDGSRTNLAFNPASLFQAPWTLLTYPFTFLGPSWLISVLFACMWLWGIGGSIERTEGPSRFLGIWIAFSVLCGVGLWIGHLITGMASLLFSPWTPLAALTVIWGTRNADAQVTFMFVLPLTGKWLAWLAAGLVFFGTQPPHLAPFAAAPLVLAYLYAAKKLPGGNPFARRRTYVRGAGGYSSEYFDHVKERERQRAERERLKRLFESSLDEEKPSNDG
jgi:membrane associated rhomboid family serine protease